MTPGMTSVPRVKLTFYSPLARRHGAPGAEPGPEDPSPGDVTPIHEEAEPDGRARAGDRARSARAHRQPAADVKDYGARAHLCCLPVPLFFPLVPICYFLSAAGDVCEKSKNKWKPNLAIQMDGLLAWTTKLKILEAA